MIIIAPYLLLIARVTVKAFPVSTVEPAKRFTINKGVEVPLT